MAESEAPSVLQIKKYPNRRFYDATRSRHVTLQDVYELVLNGHSVVVTDSRTGGDITNDILVQIVLDKDPPKLHLFPSWALHLLLRSSHDAAHSVLDRFFEPLTRSWVRGRQRLDDPVPQSPPGQSPSPAEWADNTMRMFQAQAEAASNVRHDSFGESKDDLRSHAADTSGTESALNEMKSQIAALTERIQDLQHRQRGDDFAGGQPEAGV